MPEMEKVERHRQNPSLFSMSQKGTVIHMPTEVNGLVSVVVLTHNKKEVLRQCLSSVLELDWPNLEVIVIDNVSSDGTPDMVEKEFGGAVRLIRRTVDSPTAGRNQGFCEASGEIILSLDNDMIFHDRAAIRRAVALFESLPDVGLITFKIGESTHPDEPVRRHWWHPVSYERGKDRFFYTDYFSEGAIFVRKNAIKITDGYDDEFFGAYEGVDLALRMIRRGLKILYVPSIACEELTVPRVPGKPTTHWEYFYLRNKIWTAWKHYPPLRAAWYVAPRIVRDLGRSIVYGWTSQFWKGIRDGIFAPDFIREQRQPLGSETWKTIREIRRGQFCEPANGVSV